MSPWDAPEADARLERLIDERVQDAVERLLRDRIRDLIAPRSMPETAVRPSSVDAQVLKTVGGLVTWADVSAGGGGSPSGAAGGVLGGTYPNPSFAVDMATQAELDAHAGLTTAAHGGIVSSADARLTDARTPTAHAATHKVGGADAIKLNELALPTAAVPFNGQQATGLAAGTATGHAARWDELTSGLSGKANTTHTHAQADITNLVSDLAGKASATHTHAQSDVTNLVSDLAAKAATTDTRFPTANEKAALVGTSGTAVSGTNKLVDNTDTRLANARTPTAHAASHVSGASDALSGNLDAIARLQVKKAGTLIGSRRALNLIEGTGVTLTMADDAVGEKVDVTINSSGGGGTAATTTFTPTGGVSATNVQAAIAEVDTEKANLASPTFTGTVTVPTAAAGTSATTKAQMDAADALLVAKAGDTMTGALAFLQTTGTNRYVRFGTATLAHFDIGEKVGSQLAAEDLQNARDVWRYSGSTLALGGAAVAVTVPTAASSTSPPTKQQLDDVAALAVTLANAQTITGLKRFSTGATGNAAAIITRRTADTYARMEIQNDGNIAWGDGAATGLAGITNNAALGVAAYGTWDYSSGTLKAATRPEGTSDTTVATMAALQTAVGSASSNRPACSAALVSTVTTIASGSFIGITFDTEIADSDSMFTLASAKRITFTTAGTFKVDGGFELVAHATGVRLAAVTHFNSAGTMIRRHIIDSEVATAAVNYMASGSCQIHAAAGDYVELQAWQNSGTALTLTNGNTGSACATFSAAWVGGTGAAWGNASGKVVRTSAQTIGNASWNDVTFTTVVSANGVTAAASTVPLQAIIPGRYLVTTQCAWTNNGTGSRLTRVIHKNSAGTILAIVCPSAVPGNASTLSDSSAAVQIDMAAGDFLQMQVYQDSGAVGGLATAAAGTYHITIDMARVGYQTNPSIVGQTAFHMTSGSGATNVAYGAGNTAVVAGGVTFSATVTGDGVNALDVDAYGLYNVTSGAGGFRIYADGAQVQDGLVQGTTGTQATRPYFRIPPWAKGVTKTITLYFSTTAGGGTLYVNPANPVQFRGVWANP